MLPQRRHPAKGIIEDDRTPTLIFLTVCTERRRPWLADPHIHETLVQVWRSATHWEVGPYILMPDHLHVIVSPIDARDANLGSFSAALKRWIRREVNAAWNWQPGCFDHLLRSDESLHEKWRYVQDNPVRAGLVQGAADWPYRIGLDD